jgi:hypothetical protein
VANKSARDKCFQEAVDALNDNLPDDEKIDIQHQQPWGKVDGQWRPLGAGERLWNWITNKTIPFRVPDWTITVDGKPTAGDNKFSGDSYGTRKSPRSGNTQLQQEVFVPQPSLSGVWIPGVNPFGMPSFAPGSAPVIEPVFPGGLVPVLP